MKIANGWTHVDAVTGLTLTVTDGEHLDHLRIEGVRGQQLRDFFFTKEGVFDGTGSLVGAMPNSPPAEPAVPKEDS